MNACTCHGHLGIEPTKVSDAVLQTLKGISIPTISMTLRRLGYSGLFLSGVAPRNLPVSSLFCLLRVPVPIVEPETP